MNINKLATSRSPFYAVIAEDSSHSLSPLLHTLINTQIGCNIPYYALDVKEQDLASSIEALVKWSKGLNVTIPYKSTVIPYLDIISESAKAVGAVNTIWLKNGLLYGDNTDIIGFKDTLAYFNINPRGKKALILGSGGVSRAIAFALLADGASVSMASRDSSLTLPAALQKVEVVNYNKLDYEIDILINGTPVGMDRIEQKKLVNLQDFLYLQFVFDSIYTPYYTPLLLCAQKLDIPFANGLYMLIAQGIASRAIWGSAPPVNVKDIYQSMQLHLLGKETRVHNKPIVLGGFMGVGKSFLGKELASLLDYRFIDLDKMIEQKYGKISEIFALQGEQAFRNIEKKELLALELDKTVLALGGGVLANTHLAKWLAERGIVINIDRSYEDILLNIKDDNIRPLAQDKNRLHQLYLERKGIYQTNSHFTLPATMDKKANIISLLERVSLAIDA